MYLRFLSIFIFLSLTGCSMIETARIAPGYVEAFKSINNVIFGFEDETLTPEIINRIPYASQIMRIGKGPKGLIILESKDGEENTWVSADGVYLIQRNGKIVQTKGLNNNLKEIITNLDYSNLLELDTSQVYIYYSSFSNPDLFNLKLNASFSNKGTETVILLEREVELTLIEEIVTSKTLGWEVKNLYWVDENSFIWKSVQTISPKLPKIYLEVTKKPS